MNNRKVLKEQSKRKPKWWMDGHHQTRISSDD